MTEQKRRITESVNYIRSKSPFKKNVSLALITYRDPAFLKEFVIHKKIKFSQIMEHLKIPINPDFHRRTLRGFQDMFMKVTSHNCCIARIVSFQIIP